MPDSPFASCMLALTGILFSLEFLWLLRPRPSFKTVISLCIKQLGILSTKSEEKKNQKLKIIFYFLI